MFDGSYHDWNQKRVKAIVEYYGHGFFCNKKVLDLGCGHGDIGGVLHRLGADMTAVDARQEHLKIVSKKYAGVKVVKSDLDQPWPFFGKSFDLTLDLGLMCHLRNFEDHLKAVCASTNYLILETAVLDAPNNALQVIPDGKNDQTGSFNGFSSQISVDNIERVLGNCGMTFKRMDNAKFNSGAYKYDWQPKNDGKYDIHNRRIWFCVKTTLQAEPFTRFDQPAHILTVPQPGVFSPHLTNTKVPVTHQPLVTTKSPNPPGHNRKAHPVHAFLPIKTNNKIRLFFNYYEDPNPARKAEIDLCLDKNLNNPLYDLIVIESATNPTFDYLFDKINRLAGDNDISIICNSDIFFDRTISLAHKIQHNEVYALNRWEWTNHNTYKFFEHEQHQDAWIVRGKIENVKGNFLMGKPRSDVRIAQEFQIGGYTVLNPSRSIMSYHVHNSQIRRYSAGDTIKGEYLYVPPTIIK